MSNDRIHDLAAFKEAYASLNAAQKTAVDTIEGPVMVIAGPGTGKTQILTLRIANILQLTDVGPESVLALTFTESGSKEMRERLRRYTGSTAYRVPIYTFHGFAQTLISAYPDAFPEIIGGRPASDLERIQIIESILETESITHIRPLGNPNYYVRPLLHTINMLKQEYINPDRLGEIIAEQEDTLQGMERIHQKGAHKGKVRGEYATFEKNIAKNRELQAVYRLYEQQLAEQRLFDFTDMIMHTVRVLETDEAVLRDVQERYQYVLADEHQDVNGAQNRILESLCSFHDQPNVFVVGDEKQAIYRFQGASLENFLYFEDRFPNTTTIALTENYRSGQPILDAAHSLVAVEDGPLKDLRVPLTAEAVDTASVQYRDFSHQAVEDEWLVGAVAAAVSDGVPAESIAVIVRTNREVEQLATLLRKQGLAVTASADGDILTHPVTQAVQSLIASVLTDRDESALFTVLHGAYWGISTDDLVRIAAARRYDRSLASIIGDEDTLRSLGVQNVAAAHKVMVVLQTAREKAISESPHRVLEYLLNESGLLTHLMTHDPFEGVRVTRRLYDEIESLVIHDGVSTLWAVHAQLSKRQSYGLPLTAPYIATDRHAVQVLTAHKSKGLEFHTVFVPHVHDSAWGGRSKPTYFKVPLTRPETAEVYDQLDDERRLLYVAMTRAKHALHFSAAETSGEGKVLMPSRLIADIDSAQYEKLSTDMLEAEYDPSAVLQTTVGAPTVDPALLSSLLLERGFSATSLNNYLKSPWDYLYRNVLRIPEIQPSHMQFGTAIHGVLEQLTRQHTKAGTLAELTQIKQWLEVQLNRLPLTVHEYTRLLEEGLATLTIYRDHIASTLPQRTIEEFSIRVLLPTGLAAVPEVPLTGKLDRIDLDTNGYAIRVVDYKTGKPKTRNVIEGKTKQADGAYKRQLVFYALLLDLHDDERYQCREGKLSFVQPDGKGVIHEETFTITDAEIAALKETIITSVQEVSSGAFLSLPCDPLTSDYCHLGKRFFDQSSSRHGEKRSEAE